VACTPRLKGSIMNNTPTNAISLALLVCATTILFHTASAGVIPSGEAKPDSGNAGAPATVIGGYGSALYEQDTNEGVARATVDRFVLFVGHTFSPTISLFSELEIEDAKVAGGEEGGELALEQAYLRFGLSQKISLKAGLFIPRIGILNEDHLPTAFNGVTRNQVETLVIPATWRELGIGVYGSVDNVPLQYSLGLMTGLNASGFTHGSGIREGRSEGKNAPARNLAISGSIEFSPGDFQIAASGYFGGSVGLRSGKADSLGLSSGPFGTPVILGEAHAQYEAHGFLIRILGCGISLPDAEHINHVYGNNTPSLLYGAYAEVGYDLLAWMGDERESRLIVFARYEKLDLNARVPWNALRDGTLDQRHITAGVSYLPLPNVIVKADVRVMSQGDPGQQSAFATASAGQGFQDTDTFVSLGLGFSF
jgi:hypothetical protein